MKKYIGYSLKVLNFICLTYAVVLLLKGKFEGIALLAGVTFGNPASPNSITEYLDSVFVQSLQLYRKKLTDNIAATNAFLTKLLASDFYESADGGKYITEGLMYGLAPMDSYDGYDELSTLPTDGVTEAVYDWAQFASPITYNMKEVFMNRQKIVDIVKTRILQSEEGIKEGWAQQLLWGAGDGAGRTAKTSLVNGSSGINPIAKFIDYTPTTSTAVGGINQSTSSWWRNKTGASTASTYEAFLFEVDHMYNTCALGSGGAPDLMLTDQTTYELITHAYFTKYRTMLQDGPSNFAFECKKFKNALLVMDDKVGDAAADLTSLTGTEGTIYFINTKYFRVRYDSERNWTMLKDENGKTFAKPINGDSRVGHMAWMGQVTCNNRRKQGVLGSIARTLIAP